MQLNFKNKIRLSKLDFVEIEKWEDHSITENYQINSGKNKNIIVSYKNYDLIQKAIVEFIEHYRNIYSSPENFIKRRVDYGRMKVFDEKYRKEAFRLETFKNFPRHLNFMVKSIAKSGFYFIGNEKDPDKVKCIFCQGILHDWKKTDNPKREHKKYFPTCPYLLNLNVGNEPINESEKFLTEDPDLKDWNGEVPYCVLKSDSNIELNEHEGDIEWRENTFYSFPHIVDLSLNGLFVIEKGDINYLKCHECQKEIEILKKIEKLPFSLFHKSFCGYLKIKELTNEDGEVNDMKNDSQIRNYCEVEYSITSEEIEARLDSRKAELYKDLIKDRNKIKDIISEKFKKTGKDYDSTYELLSDLKCSKKKVEILHIFNSQDFLMINHVCVVCLDKPTEVVFLPCGHLKTCNSCSAELTSCPVCRQLIEKRVRGIRFCDKLSDNNHNKEIDGSNHRFADSVQN